MGWSCPNACAEHALLVGPVDDGGFEEVGDRIALADGSRDRLQVGAHAIGPPLLAREFGNGGRVAACQRTINHSSRAPRSLRIDRPVPHRAPGRRAVARLGARALARDPRSRRETQSGGGARALQFLACVGQRAFAGFFASSRRSAKRSCSACSPARCSIRRGVAPRALDLLVQALAARPLPRRDGARPRRSARCCALARPERPARANGTTCRPARR